MLRSLKAVTMPTLIAWNLRQRMKMLEKLVPQVSRASRDTAVAT
jgi:hypothetical protein